MFCQFFSLFNTETCHGLLTLQFLMGGLSEFITLCQDYCYNLGCPVSAEAPVAIVVRSEFEDDFEPILTPTEFAVLVPVKKKSRLKSIGWNDGGSNCSESYSLGEFEMDGVEDWYDDPEMLGFGYAHFVTLGYCDGLLLLK